MNIVEKLDLAIKAKEIGTTEGAYAVPYKDEVLYKSTYMTNKEWETFLLNMPAAARTEFEKGDGDELKEKDGRPPKMASYGSSSRMIYNLSNKREGFHFEKKLPTTVGGTANLDGFYEDDNRYIFVEAKCHEPYTAKNVTVSKCYEKLYKYINEKMVGTLRIDMETSKCGKFLNVEYFAGVEKLEHLDIKQMICHLLGIATGILKGTVERKQIDFIYLFYDPTDLDIEPRAKEKIDEIYKRTCYECNLVDFAKLYSVLMSFLREEKYADAISDADFDDTVHKFTFALKSQTDYPTVIVKK